MYFLLILILRYLKLFFKNSVIKTAYETEPTNIKSEVINKKTILKKLLTEDASLFDEIEKNVIPSTPETVCLERRRLRFHEPQVIIIKYTY